MECDGNGYCLSVRNLVCTYECVAQECPNAFFCGNTAPQFLLDFNQGVCNSCIAHFGSCVENPTPSNPILQRVVDDDVPECPVCFTCDPTEGGVRGPRCSHYLCLTCVRLIYTDHEGTFPPFPLPEVEDEYFADPTLFIHSDPIREWRKTIGSWNFKRMHYLARNRPYLKHCPLCRR